MTPEQIIILIESIAIVGLLIALIVVILKTRKPKGKGDDVYLKEGVRYSKTSDTHNEDGSVSITHREGDILLKTDKTYKAEKDGYVIPGKYVVLSSVESVKEFNIRIGGFVRTVKHEDEIVLREGDEITPVSHPIILR